MKTKSEKGGGEKKGTWERRWWWRWRWIISRNLFIRFLIPSRLEDSAHVLTASSSSSSSSFSLVFPPPFVTRQWPFKLSTLPTSSSLTGTCKKDGITRCRHTQEDISINPTLYSIMEEATTHAREEEKLRFPPTIHRRLWTHTLCNCNLNLNLSLSL